MEHGHSTSRAGYNTGLGQTKRQKGGKEQKKTDRAEVTEPNTSTPKSSFGRLRNQFHS